jgi:dTDP-4-dehydrorhamnose 3,5-epimerase
VKLIKTLPEGLFIIEPDVFYDNRGWFFESYSKIKFSELNLRAEFVQDNHSFSANIGTLRGLHFQLNPKAQAKLVRCSRGKILDVAVDIRKKSLTYKKWVAVELSAENKKQFFIPKGFAHGFLTLSADAEVEYKTDEYYSPDCDASIKWNDPDIGVAWGVDDPVISDKDLNAPLFVNCGANFD